jgi:dipeptidyl aminopeptidase/acylaminoacyl peptidase
MDRHVAAYGAWPSPISAQDVARARLRLSFPTVVGDCLWWQEIRPEEGGRTTIVRRTAAGELHCLPRPWDASTRVHEYGGRSYLPVSDEDGGGVVFADGADQRLRHTTLAPHAAVVRVLTPEPAFPAALRYADFTLSPDRREVWCVRERHDASGAIDRAIVAVPLDGSAADDPDAVAELAVGADFFACPTPSPDGRGLAWICWNHPDMPWDGTELRVGPAVPGRPSAGRVIMGGRRESVLAPSWRDESTVYALSDRSGWWNLYRIDVGRPSPARAVYPVAEEFAEPPWSLGERPYAMLADGRLAVLHGIGEARLGLLDPATGVLTDVDSPYTEFEPALSADGTVLAGVAGGPTRPSTVVRIEAGTGTVEPIRAELTDLPPEELLPRPSRIEFHDESGAPVHALIYPPRNPVASAPAGTSPPYVVWAHGGPTGRATATLDLTKAYFTSRGIGIVDVNYGGSSGYGRTYRERLRGRWGIVDVADLAAAGRALADLGIADPDRIAVRGPSAGGASALAAVTTGVARHGPVFAAAVSYFGVADLSSLVEQTHDFESRYLDGLIGSLPEAVAVYRERSAIGHIGPTTCPILLFQGLEDPVVPPSQSAAVAAELVAHHIRHGYFTFPEESHGFRKADTIIACLEAELSFYEQVLGVTAVG